VAQSA